MAYQIADATLHIDETLEAWQQSVLEDHLRLNDGVVGAGHSAKAPHVMIIEYNPDRTCAMKFLNMVKRHGYHAEWIG